MTNRWFSAVSLGWLGICLTASQWGLFVIELSATLSAQVAEPTLQRVPPLSLEQAQAAIEVVEGYEVELVAAEPLIVDPIAMQFDEQGRLVVVEMIDYSEQSQERLGRISRLSDSDSDGQMDRRETIAENLSWPTALAVTAKGILVVHPPYLTLCRESSPGVWSAELLLEGFQRNNVQGMANSFRWGLDNRWHLSTSSNGARLTGVGLEKPIELFGRDLVLDPIQWKVDDEPGGGQHGMDFNLWGDKFVSGNSDHLQQVVAIDADRWTGGALNRSRALRRSIAIDGPQADVFRLSPVEAWRTARTQQRISGAVQGPIEGGGRAAGYFTGATGVFLYDGDQWGESQPTAIIADVGGNLVHRKRLEENGIAWIGSRIDSQTEWMRSRDIWFRPVQFGDGPDGCLYVVDMCREVIEHPASLPPTIKSQLDLTSGRDRGRIWRVRRKDRDIRRLLTPLDQLPIDQLCEQLEHRNGWNRETAARWIYENQLVEAAPILRKIAQNSERAESRLQAISLLNGLPDGLEEATLHRALHDENPRVLAATCYLLCQSKNESARSDRVRKRLFELSEHPSILVRLAVAVALPNVVSRDDVPTSVWLQLIATSEDQPEIRAAVAWSIGERAESVLKELLNHDKNRIVASDHSLTSEVLLTWLDLLIDRIWLDKGWARAFEICRSQENRSVELTNGLNHAWANTLTRHVSSLNHSERSELKDWVMQYQVPVFHEKLMSQVGFEDSEWLFQYLSILEPNELVTLLDSILQNNVAPVAQGMAVEYWVVDRSTAEKALERYAVLELESRLRLMRRLVQKRDTTETLLSAVEAGKIAKESLPIDVWVSLLQSSDQEVAKRSRDLRGANETVLWERIAERYRSAWVQPSNKGLGRELFGKHCSACHRVGDVGKEIGPGLSSVLSKSNEQIALAIAEPSREIDPKYQVVQVLTHSGQLFVGMLESSNSSEYTLRDAKGERILLEREEVEEIGVSPKSLMPEGLLDVLDPGALNDLIGFLRDPI